MRRFIVLALLAVAAVENCQATEPPGDVHKRGEPPSQFIPPTWSLESLEALALERNPTLAAAGAQIEIARGKAIQAGLYPNPTVGYVAEQIGAGGTAGELQGAFVQQEIVTAKKLQLSRAKFQQELLQAEVFYQAQEYRITSSVRKSFYQTLISQEQVRTRRDLLRNAEDVLATAKELVNVGQANKPDRLQAEVEANRARAQLRIAERQLVGHWQQLTAYVGAPELEPAPLVGSVEIDEDEILDRDVVLENLLIRSPQLQTAWAEVARDRIAVRREAAEPISNLNVRGEVGYNFEAEDTVAGATIGIKLPIFDRNQGGVMQARAELARAEADVARIELILHQKLADRFSEYEAALEEVRVLQKEALPAAREAYAAYLEAFKNRRAAWPQVLVAQREYFKLTNEYLDELIKVRGAEADIKGLFLGDGLDQPLSAPSRGHQEATPRPR